MAKPRYTLTIFLKSSLGNNPDRRNKLMAEYTNRRVMFREIDELIDDTVAVVEYLDKVSRESYIYYDSRLDPP